MNETVVILDNVRSAHNVGSIFRTADAAGVAHLYLVGITPKPIDRFGRVQSEIQKTSLGANQTVAWSQVGAGEDLATTEALALIEKLRSEGFRIVAVEQAAHAVPVKSLQLPEKVAYIFGAEVEGVQAKVIEAADVVTELPMLGRKESLNVSVTAGIVLFRPLV